MAKHKSKSEIKERFVLELPLKHEPWQRDKLDRMFSAGNNIKNALIAKEKKALEQMTRTYKWKVIQSNLADIYERYAPEMAELEKLQKEKKVLKEKGKPLSKEKKNRIKELKKVKAERDALLKPWLKHRNDMLSCYGMSEYSFHSEVKWMQRHYKGIIGSNVAQKIASNVWMAFSSYLFDKGEKIKFSKWENFFSIEGKNNAANIIFDKAAMSVKIRKMSIPVKRSKSDPYGYEEEALSRNVCYCRIIRRAYPEGWRYFLQLALEGVPPIKTKLSTGELLHPIGDGRVGLDIGTQTLATCADNAVSFDVLAPGVQDIQDELRRINRAMDRSRKATNPEFFNTDGTVIHIDKLPKELLTKHGKRRWKMSKHYKKLAQYRRYLYRKQADLRKQCHKEMANYLLGLGDTFYIEEMQFRALAKRTKEAKKNKDGKNLSRKRFGKSIAKRAPALFVTILEKKVKNAGGKFYRINTWDAKASQYNHMTGRYTKKKLSQRVNTMPDGRKIQRDLYSAFLIQHTNPDLSSFNQESLDRDYENFVTLHDAAMRRLEQIDTYVPSSMGRGLVA